MNWNKHCQQFEQISLEVGFGKSCTLLKLAPLFPKRLYIGVEISREYCQLTKEKINTQNLIIVNDDIRTFIREIPSGIIHNYYIYFPSPGPPNQRIFTIDFHDQLFRTLTELGMIKIATDDSTYFKKIMSLFSGTEWSHSVWHRLPFIAADSEYIVGTDCEKKYGWRYHIECYKK